MCPLPPALRRRDPRCDEAGLNEIEEEFFLFCSSSFWVFTRFSLKLLRKSGDKVRRVGQEAAGLWLRRLFRRGSAASGYLFN